MSPDSYFSGIKTICIAATSIPVAGVGGCPAGAAAYMQPLFNIAINSYAKTDTRVLFNGGDTFSVTASGSITKTGPGMISSYGTGKAKITSGALVSGDILKLSSGSTAGIKDWRITNLDFDGLGHTANASLYGIEAWGGINQVLIDNVSIHDIGSGITINNNLPDSSNLGNPIPRHTLYDQLTIANTTIVNAYNTMSVAATRIAVIGSQFSISPKNLASFVFLQKAAINNNSFNTGSISIGSSCRSVITCPTQFRNGTSVTNTEGDATTGSSARNIIFSDNYVVTNTTGPWPIAIKSAEGYIKDVIVERNFFQNGAGAAQVMIYFSAEEGTFRNNILDVSNMNWKTAIALTSSGASQPIANIRVYNNTFYNSILFGNDTLYGLTTNNLSVITNISYINNLMYSPTSARVRPSVYGGTTPGLVQMNNSTEAQGFINPFAVATPAIPSDCKLKATSFAIGSGAPVWVPDDFYGAMRTTNDLGAIKP